MRYVVDCVVSEQCILFLGSTATLVLLLSLSRIFNQEVLRLKTSPLMLLPLVGSH